MRIALNLATRPFSDQGPVLKQLRIAMAAMAVVALGLTWGLHAIHQQAEQARERAASLDAAIARINQERASYQAMMRQPDNAQLLTHVGILNKLFDEKSFSWTLAMEDLETVLPGGIQTTTLEPIRDKFGNTTLRLRVVGPRDKVLDLVRNLERSKRFVLPRIVGENSEATGSVAEKMEPISPSNRFNFDLLADYSPATPDEVRAIHKAGKKPEAGESSTKTAENPAHTPTSAKPGANGPRPPYTGQAHPPASLQPSTNQKKPGGTR